MQTCMLMSYAKSAFPQGYIPTVFDNYAVSLQVDKRPITLTLCDTAGQEDYDRLRPLSYPSANIFLVCFSTSSRSSFENVQEKWAKELRKYAPGVPIILVGTQVDKRDDGGIAGDWIGTAEGKKMAKAIRAEQYIECSAVTRKGLKEVFFAAITAAIMPRKKESKCLIF